MGSKFFNFITHQQKQLKARGMVWEVDSIEESDTSAEREIRQRRNEYFSRLGGQCLEATYTQPAVEGINSAPMTLMTKYLSDHKRPSAAKLTHDIYHHKYHKVNGICKIKS